MILDPMERMKRADIDATYDRLLPVHERLGTVMVSTLRSLLKSAEIKFVDVPYRVKTRKSTHDKFKKKRYPNFSMITDLLGLRVIVYRESDLALVEDLLRRSFFIVVAEQSVDKSALLEPHELGYRSVHCICECDAERCKLPEFKDFAGLRFEIQIRTILQHTWAEIEHAHYKNRESLPKDLKRRLYLVAGQLEIADRELTQISEAIDAYAQQAEAEVKRGELKDAPLDAFHIDSLVREVFPPGPSKGLSVLNDSLEVLSELGDFKLTNLGDLKPLLVAWKATGGGLDPDDSFGAGLLRNVMMYADLPRYFQDCWKMHWTAMDQGDEAEIAILEKKYSREVVRDVFREAARVEAEAERDQAAKRS